MPRKALVKEDTSTMKKLTKVLSLMLVAALILGTFAVPASAAAKKTVKKHGFETRVAPINKCAAVVKKGTTNLTIKGGEGYVKFVAPKTKKYSFTFSNLKNKGGVSGFVEMQTRDGEYCWLTKVKTKGGQSDTLWLSINGAKSSSSDTLNKRLASRTGTYTLKKGEAMYMYVYTNMRKTTCKLVIK